MSLETLLEAAEFLEWSKTGKKTASRATRTSKKAEKFKPYVLTEKKRRTPSKTASAKARATTASSKQEENQPIGNDDEDVMPPPAKQPKVEDNTVDEHDEDDQLDEDEDGQQITLREIKKSIGTRETHNKLEKNRRAHLKECFEDLRRELPLPDERRSSNLATLRSALRLIDQLLAQQKELESEKRRMQRLRNTRQAQINMLRKDLQDKGIEYNIEDWIERHKTSTNSTSTASEVGEPVTLETLNAEAAALTALIDGHSSAKTLSGEDVQLVIKALPPTKTKPVLNPTAKLSLSDNVLVEAPVQAIQMIQQAAIKASAQQRLNTTSGAIQVVQANTVNEGTTMLTTKSPSIAPATTGTQVSTNKPSVTITKPSQQVLAMAKLPHGGMPQKIIFTPKPPTTTIPISQHHQQLSLGQVIVSNANFFVSQGQPVNAGPITVNLNTGKVINPQPVRQQQIFARPPDQTNPTIAPKQLVLITADQQKIRAVSANPQAGTSMGAVGIARASHMNSVIPISQFGNVQTMQVNPTSFITGMLPTTAADGTVSYVPVQLTTRPTGGDNTASTQFLNGGLTFVIPPSSSASSTSGVHLVQQPSHAHTTHNIQIAAAPPSNK